MKPGELQRKRRFGLAHAAVIVVCLFAFGLRIYEAGLQGIWGDEVYSLIYARARFVEIIATNIRMEDPQAPFYFIVLKIWTALGGLSELSLRFPSLAFGVLTIPVIYLIGRKLVGPWVGSIAALIMAVNPFQVWFAQEARPYTLIAFLTALSVVFMLQILRGRSNPWFWGGYILVTDLSIYSHYYSFLIMLFTNLVFLVFIIRGRIKAWHWALALVFLVLPYLPWAQRAANLILSYPAWRETMTPLQMVQSTFSIFTVGSFIEPDTGKWLVAAFVLFAILGVVAFIVSRLNADRPSLHFHPLESLFILLAYFGVPFITTILYVTITGRFLFQERYLIIVTPALYLLVASGFASLKKLSPVLLALGLIFVTSIGLYSNTQYYHNPRYMKPDYRSIANLIEARGRQGDAVVSLHGIVTSAFTYYYKGNLPITDVSGVPNEELTTKMQQVAKDSERVWLLPYGSSIDPPETWLNQNAYRANSWWFAPARMTLYATQNKPLLQPQSITVNLENKIELTGYQSDVKDIEAGKAVKVFLKWQALADLDKDYKMSLRLLDSKGHVLSQLDRNLGMDEMITSIWKKGYTVEDRLAIIVPDDVLPGQYTVDISVYDKSNMKHLTALDRNMSPAGIRAKLDQVQVKKGRAIVSPDKLDIPRREAVQLGSHLRLIGYDFSNKVTAGSKLDISLFWQSSTKIQTDVKFLTELVDSTGTAVASRQGSDTNEHYPTSKWAEGEIVHDFTDISIPANIPNGKYNLRLSEMRSRSELAAIEANYALLGSIEVEGRDRRFELPSVENPRSEQFGNWAKLVGFDLDPEHQIVKAGQKLRLKLYWQAAGTPPTNYKVFVHFIDSQEKKWGQHDSVPGNDAAPTITWVANEVIEDIHEFEIKSDTPKGRYSIAMGFYDPQSYLRAKTAQGQDRIIVTTVEVQ